MLAGKKLERPSHYAQLPRDLTCRCMSMWCEPDGSTWCCQGQAGVTLAIEVAAAELAQVARAAEVKRSEESQRNIPRIVPKRSTEEVAADLKRRLHAAFNDHVAPVIMEAIANGLDFTWDAIEPEAPGGPPVLHNVRVIKTY